MITSCRAARWITCGAIGACALVARAETLQNNGPLSTGATANRGTAAPAGTTWSEVQNNTGNNTESNTLAGTSAVVGSFRLADNFSVPAGERWTVTSVLQFAYRTGAPATPSPFTGGPATLRIWRGRPGDVGSVVVFGDTTSNRLSASVDNLMFRIFNSSVPPPGTAPGTTRRIWRNTLDVNPPLTLGPGEYWVDFDLIGANFVPSVTLRGNRGDMPAQGWNARQFSVATGAKPLQDPLTDSFQLGHAAATCLARAIARAVWLARSEPGDLLPAWSARFSA